MICGVTAYYNAYLLLKYLLAGFILKLASTPSIQELYKSKRVCFRWWARWVATAQNLPHPWGFISLLDYNQSLACLSANTQRGVLLTWSHDFHYLVPPLSRFSICGQQPRQSTKFNRLDLVWPQNRIPLTVFASSIPWNQCPKDQKQKIRAFVDRSVVILIVVVRYILGWDRSRRGGKEALWYIRSFHLYSPILKEWRKGWEECSTQQSWKRSGEEYIWNGNEESTCTTGKSSIREVDDDDSVTVWMKKQLSSMEVEI